MAFAHQKNVTAGHDCIISPLCSLEHVTLGDAVRVGDGAQLKNVVLGSHTKIGRNVTLYSSEPERPVRVGRHCWFSVGAFGEGTGGEIRIGDHAVVAHGTRILTSSGPGEQSPIMNALFPVQLGAVLIGDHSWLGAHSLVLPGATLGEGVVLAANSMLRSGQYEGWCVYGGSPARLIRVLDRQAVQEAKARFAAVGRSD
jgi:acetyltransferase-like isoleucine patch superfamily enzyme